MCNYSQPHRGRSRASGTIRLCKSESSSNLESAHVALHALTPLTVREIGTGGKRFSITLPLGTAAGLDVYATLRMPRQVGQQQPVAGIGPGFGTTAEDTAEAEFCLFDM